jgi:hypothetical protein
MGHRFAVSRLASGNVATDLAADPSDLIEIACVRGLPIETSLSGDITFVREWPNLAGRCEPFQTDDIVRWDQSLAPTPRAARIVPRGVAPDSEVPAFDQLLQWFRPFVRSLEQRKGVIVAAPFETTQCILITPWGVDERTGIEHPNGLTAVPTALREFPGGVVITFTAGHWGRRDEYASNIRKWFAAQGQAVNTQE